MILRSIFPSFCCFLLLLTLGGCGPKHKVQKGRVNGVVTLNGKPVAEGSVTLFSTETGTGGTGFLTEGGKYEISIPLEFNKYEVVVVGLQGEPGSAPVKPTEIPRKYWQSTTSGLVCVIDKSVNTFDIELKKQ